MRTEDRDQASIEERSALDAAKPTMEEWRKVVRAIETSIPVYDSVSEKISFNRAIRARRLAIEFLNPVKDGWVVDVGVGPGVSTRLLLHEGFEQIVGLDPSVKLLKHVSEIFHGEYFHPVLAVSEYLPFRSKSVSGVLTCFALRDVLDPDVSLGEFSRVVDEHGRFAVVDVGKPGNIVVRFFVSLYIRFGMPVLSSILAWRRVEGNPFRMIIPTYDRLVSNNVLEESAGRVFGSVELRSIMLGGLIVLMAEQTG